MIRQIGAKFKQLVNLDKGYARVLYTMLETFLYI